MHSLIKSCIAATALSLTVATGAIAAQLEAPQPAQTSTAAETLVAQFRTETSPYYSRALLVDMMTANMKMLEMGEQALKSDDPAIRTMGQQMIDTANKNMISLLDMARQVFLKNPDR